LSPAHYQEFCERYLRKIVSAIKSNPDCATLPLIVFAKGANAHLESLSHMGADALGLDWTVAISHARARTENRVALQGNLDPAVLYAKPEHICAEVAMLLEDATTTPGHIFNLGHGMNPDMLPEHAAALIDAVHRYSVAQRARPGLV
jgi:uroporphyrinogen decarboxylase